MEINIPSLVRIKPKALNKLGKYLRTEKLNNVALFWGESIKDLFGTTVSVSLDSSEIKVGHEFVVQESDIEEIFARSLTLSSRTKAIVAIGGGKAIDYCKYLSFIKKLPLYSVPTIISNDAFCSSNASLIVKGKKKSFQTKLPDGVIVDTDVLSSAPASSLYSGIGELFSKITSLYDWRLAYRRDGEFVNDFALVITYNAVDAFYHYSPKDFKNLELIRIIATSLMMTGIAMEIAGSSRPASGSEHLISHAYDRISEKPTLHGIQVGVASYAVSFLQEATHEKLKFIVQDSSFMDFVAERPLSKQDFIDAIKFAPNIKEDFYTILSEKNSISKLVDFVNHDEFLNKMLT